MMSAPSWRSWRARTSRFARRPGLRRKHICSLASSRECWGTEPRGRKQTLPRVAGPEGRKAGLHVGVAEAKGVLVAAGNPPIRRLARGAGDKLNALARITT